MTTIPPASPTLTEISPVAREIRRRMLEHNLNPSSLAKLAGVGPTYIYDLLSGKSGSPVLDKLRKIAKALDCDIDDLTPPEVGGHGSQPEGSNLIDASGVLPLRPSEPALIKLWRMLPKRSRDDVIAYMKNATIAYISELTTIDSGSDDTDAE